MHERTGRRIVMRLNVLCGLGAVVVVGFFTASAPGAERKLNDRRARCAVGQRIAYEESFDSTLPINVDATRARAGAKTVQTTHAQIIVTSEEPIALGAGGDVTAKRVTFGPNFFSFVQVDDKPRRVSRLPYGNKAVTFRLLEDDTVEQDFGVKVAGEQMRKRRNSIFSRASVFPAAGVAVGDRWRADDVMRRAMSFTDSLS